MPNVKPKAGVLLVIAVVELVDAEGSVDDAELESEVVGKVVSVGIGMVPMVLATSLFTEGVPVVVGVPDAEVAAPQSVADTVVVVVDTTVTVTMLFVPTTTVGVTIPFVAEEVVEVPALDRIFEETDVGLRVGSDDVVEVDEDVKI